MIPDIQPAFGFDEVESLGEIKRLPNIVEKKKT